MCRGTPFTLAVIVFLTEMTFAAAAGDAFLQRTALHRLSMLDPTYLSRDIQG